MLKIRLQRHGSKHSPFYRMVVAPSTVRRDGRFLEILGTYDPNNRKREEELKLKLERIDYWLSVGAQPSDTAKNLIRNGRLSPEEYAERMDKKNEAKELARKKSAAPTAPSVDEDAPAADEEPAAEEPAAEEPAAEAAAA
ncbi:MAG: 30S ribosomal protein S16, partial [Opitutales bacterium]